MLQVYLLLVVIVGACKPKPADSPIENQGTQLENTAKQAEVGRPKIACIRELEKDATHFFQQRVTLPLPKNIRFVEQNPFFARITALDQTSACGGIVSFAAIGYFHEQPQLSNADIRLNLLAFRGIDAQVAWEQENTVAADYSGIYQVPQGSNGEPSRKGLLVIKRDDKRIYWLIYESQISSWDRLQQTFIDSAAQFNIGSKPQASQ